MARLTEEAYKQGLEHGFAMAKAQYEDMLISKEQATKAIEYNVCKWCNNYHAGQFSDNCQNCKVSKCYQAIDVL